MIAEEEGLEEDTHEDEPTMKIDASVEDIAEEVQEKDVDEQHQEAGVDIASIPEEDITADRAYSIAFGGTLEDGHQDWSNQIRRSVLVDSKSDPWLARLAREAHALVEAIPSEMAVLKAQLLAVFTCAHMGGAQVCVVLSELSPATTSGNVVSAVQLAHGTPIKLGAITHGYYHHRALLYKYLCCREGVRVSLIRGNSYDIEHGWNEFEHPEHGRCIVDLMNHPGVMYPSESREAESYLTRAPPSEPKPI